LEEEAEASQLPDDIVVEVDRLNQGWKDPEGVAS